MAKIDRRTPNDRKPVPEPKPETSVSAPSDTKPAKPEVDRLTIPIKSDGSPDFESMREKTKERVKKLVTDPEVARKLGISAESAPVGSAVPPFVAHVAIHALGQLDTIIIARTTNAPPEILAAVGPYTPEQVELLAPAMDRVLNKYGGSLVGKWGDELGLAALLVSITMRKIELAKRAMSDTKRPAPVLVHPSTPPPAAPAVEPIKPDTPKDPDAGAVSPEVFQ